MNDSHKEAIKKALSEKTERRKNQIPLTIEFKLCTTKKWQKEHLNTLFREAKYLYN